MSFPPTKLEIPRQFYAYNTKASCALHKNILCIKFECLTRSLKPERKDFWRLSLQNILFSRFPQNTTFFCQTHMKKQAQQHTKLIWYLIIYIFLLWYFIIIHVSPQNNPQFIFLYHTRSSYFIILSTSADFFPLVSPDVSQFAPESDIFQNKLYKYVSKENITKKM